MKNKFVMTRFMGLGILLWTHSTSSLAQSLVHDDGFATNGVLHLPLGGPTSHTNLGVTMLVQPDGKIVFSGVYESNGTYSSILVRRNADGTADNTFDGDGIRIDDFATDFSYFYEIALQSDNKIVAVGSMGSGPSQNTLVARYNPNGTLDNSFGTSGFVNLNVSGYDEYAANVDIQSDGKILVGGNTTGGINGDDFVVLRLNTNGSLDTTFNTTGFLVADIAGEMDNILCSALQPDGKLLVGGFTYDSVSDEDFLLFRLNADGSFDNSFGSSGIVQTQVGSTFDELWDMALQDDGKILATGLVTKIVGGNEYMDFVLVRYNADGSLDNSFDTDGIALTPFGPTSQSSQDAAYTLAIDANDKILVAGSVTIGGQENFAMVRYNTDGSIDATFDTDGYFTEDMGSDQEVIFQMGIQSDGKILAMGSFADGGDSDFLLVRYQLGGFASVNSLEDPLTSIHAVPNPTTGVFQVSIPAEQNLRKLEIWNAAGQRIRQSDAAESSTYWVDLTSEEDGIYVIRAVFEQGVVTTKVIKGASH